VQVGTLGASLALPQPLLVRKKFDDVDAVRVAAHRAPRGSRSRATAGNEKPDIESETSATPRSKM
jgi:hypothetical protein